MALKKPRSTRTRPTVNADGAREVIDLNRYVPFFMTTIANTWSRGASKVYLIHFGIGVLDWAMISTLAMEPLITMQRLCEFCAADKAAVSRSIAGLEQKEIVKSEVYGKDIRRRTLQLTKLGYQLHDKIIALALKREKLLLKGLQATDLAALTRALNRMHKNLEQLQAWDDAAVIDGAKQAR
jgi:DNA-binding MarR family transcriptional regulator